MDVNYIKEDKLLVLKITEELDHHVVEKIRRKADYEIEKHIPNRVLFDFDNVSFMDSAGIGLILGRYKNTTMLGGKFEVINVNSSVNKILKLSGISNLINIKEKECVYNDN